MMRVQTVNLRHRKADRLICTCRVSQQTPPSISWMGRSSCSYHCKNVTRALGLGLIGCYQPLALRKIIEREEKGRRRKRRRGDTASGHPSSFQILSFFLSLCFPKQSHSQLPPPLSPPFLLSLISRRHSFKSVPFRCSRPSSCLAGWFVNTRRCGPTFADVWDFSSRTNRAKTKR